MSCVNTNSKEFKSLLSKVNVSSGTLELLIHKLQNDNENAPYPTPSEVIAKLSPKAFTSNADMIHAWVNNYSKPKYFKLDVTLPFYNTREEVYLSGIIPTKQGYHLLVRPFNLKEFSDKFPNIDVHKNSMGTLLYYPNSISV